MATLSTPMLNFPAGFAAKTGMYFGPAYAAESNYFVALAFGAQGDGQIVFVQAYRCDKNSDIFVSSNWSPVGGATTTSGLMSSGSDYTYTTKLGFALPSDFTVSPDGTIWMASLAGNNMWIAACNAAGASPGWTSSQAIVNVGNVPQGCALTWRRNMTSGGYEAIAVTHDSNVTQTTFCKYTGSGTGNGFVSVQMNGNTGSLALVRTRALAAGDEITLFATYGNPGNSKAVYPIVLNGSTATIRPPYFGTAPAVRNGVNIDSNLATPRIRVLFRDTYHQLLKYTDNGASTPTFTTEQFSLTQYTRASLPNIGLYTAGQGVGRSTPVATYGLVQDTASTPYYAVNGNDSTYSALSTTAFVASPPVALDVLAGRGMGGYIRGGVYKLGWSTSTGYLVETDYATPAIAATGIAGSVVYNLQAVKRAAVR